MRTIILPLALLLAGLTAGCKLDAAPEADLGPDLGIGAFETLVAPSYPAECSTGRDPRWVELPDADVRRSEAVRRERANRDSFRTLAARRRICAAALTALAGSP